MAGITNGNHAHTVFLSLFDCHFHRLVTDDLSHTVMTVNNSRCRSFLNNFKIRDRILNTCFDSVDINRLEAVAAVGFDTASVRFKDNVNNNLAVLSRNTYTLERINHKIMQCFPIAYNFAHNKTSYVNK